MQDDQIPTGGDMAQTVTQIDRSIKERRYSDTVLVNFWLYFFLLSWITFGIYGIVLFFQRINRIDRFSSRKQRYYEGLITWTERFAQQHKQENEVHDNLTDMRSDVVAAYRGDLRQMRAGLSFLLTIVTIGIYGFYVLYRLNRYWWDAQVVEQEFDDRLSLSWTKLGLMRYPIGFTLDQEKRRSYPLYLILSIITVGIWAIVWDYKLQTDPENLYGEFHTNEDTALQVVRSR
jgi:hypothetical protein